MEIPRRIGGAAATSRPSLAAIGHNMDDVIVTCCFAAIMLCGAQINGLLILLMSIKSSPAPPRLSLLLFDLLSETPQSSVVRRDKNEGRSEVRL